MAEAGSRDFGALLRDYRVESGWTQEELAERAGISVQAVSTLERGTRQLPRPATVRRLADALAISEQDRSRLQFAARRPASSQSDGQVETRESRAGHGASEKVLPVGGFLGSLPPGPLIGRLDEVAQLCAAVEAVEAGQGRILLLAGEPGIGKTRLAQEVARVLDERGFLVAAGRCYGPEQVVPYYPFLDVLEDLYRIAPEQVRDDLPRRWPHLVRLLPELQERGRPSSLIGTGEQDEPFLIRSVAAFIETLANDRPLAILLDDLHWSDSASVKLLLHLAGHTRASRLFLLGTYRDIEVTYDHSLHGALVDLSRDGLLEKIVLARLDEEAIAGLIAAMLGDDALPPGLAEIVHGPTGGNPFFIQEVVRSMVEAGDLFQSGGRWERRHEADLQVPESVRLVIGQRLARLAPDTQEVLFAASVLGQVFTFEEAERVSAHPEDQVESALKEASQAGLVRETQPDVYAFSHALAQQAVYGEMSGRKQRRLHLLAAETLEGQPDRERRAGEIASHFLRTGEKQRAIPYSILAGDAAREVFAHTEAERHYRSALESSRAIGKTTAEAEALQKLAATLMTRGRYQEAEESAERSVALFASIGDMDGKIRATTRLSQVLASQGRSREALTVCRRLLESLDGPTASPDLAVLYLEMTHLHFNAGAFQDAAATAEVAAEMAQVLGDERLRAQVELNRSWALGRLQRHAEARVILQRLLQLAEERDDVLSLFPLLVPLGQVSVYLGDLQASKHYRERLVEVARRIGNPASIASALSFLGNSRFLLGDWHGARTDMEEAMEIAHSLDNAGVLVIPPFDLGHLTVCEGDWDTGEAYLHQSLDMVERSGDFMYSLLVHLYLANLELLRGRPEAVIQRIPPLLAHPGSTEAAVAPLLPVLAQAYLAMGDVDRADSVASDAVHLATEEGNRLDLLPALLSKAGVLEKRGRLDEARARVEEALHLAREMAFPAGEALALRRRGTLESHTGNVDPARSCLEESRAIYRRLGACKEVEQIDQALDMLIALG